jgi:hypothetical protein
MLDGFRFDSKAKPLDQACLGSFETGKSLTTHNLARALVGYSKYDGTTALIGKSGAILDQSVEVKVVRCCLEF